MKQVKILRSEEETNRWLKDHDNKALDADIKLCCIPDNGEIINIVFMVTYEEI